MPEQSGRRCVFCDHPAGSREHALRAWQAKTMGVESEPSQLGLISTAKGVEAQGNPRATGKLITKGVCQNEKLASRNPPEQWAVTTSAR